MDFCSSCGQRISSDDKFCISCGQRVDAANIINQANNQAAAAIETNIPAMNTLPPQNNPMSQVSKKLTEPLSMGSYLLTLFLCNIPLVGLILTIVWAVDTNTNVNKRNLCRAILVLWLISIVLSVFLFSAIAGAVDSMLRFS